MMATVMRDDGDRDDGDRDDLIIAICPKTVNTHAKKVSSN